MLKKIVAIAKILIYSAPVKITEDHITLRPVGVVRSEIKEPSLRADDDGLTRQVQVQQEKEYRKKLKTLVSELVKHKKSKQRSRGWIE